MNNYFQFKKFTIYQDQCAMKVTEIACIQGAWCELPEDAQTILDIGCGTGLLSLMIAQKNKNVRIDAVEIDSSSYNQAKHNIENSAYKHQIHCIHSDIKNHLPNDVYDFIICNPPFFEQQLKSLNKQKNTAWHSEQLTLKELVRIIHCLLKPSGSFCILLPIHRMEELNTFCAALNFFSIKTLAIRHSTQHPVTHQVSIFSKKIQACHEAVLSIKEDGKYTDDFTQLLGAYYLKL